MTMSEDATVTSYPILAISLVTSALKRPIAEVAAVGVTHRSDGRAAGRDTRIMTAVPLSSGPS